MRTSIWASWMAAALIACSPSNGGNTAGRPSAPPSNVQASSIPPEIASKRIAFMDGERLYTAKADGSERTFIARIPGAYSGPYWSEASQRYLVRAETKKAGYVYVVSEDGSRVVNVSKKAGSSTDAMAGWSPDGDRIVFTSRRAGEEFAQLYVMDADGSNVEQLTDGDMEAQYPAWSPDGKHIAFTGVLGTQGDNFDIYVMDSDGGNVTRLTETPEAENWATWSPDGDAIAFSIEQPEGASIWAVDADGSNRRQLTDPAVTSAGEPSWSRTVDWLTFDCATDPPPARICAIRGDGTGFVELFGGATFPYWVD